MKILLINSHYNVGGAARIAGYIHEQLAQKGHEVKTVYGRGDESQDPNIIKVESNVAAYHDALMTRLTGKVGHYNKGASRKIAGLIKEWKPDIIHIHNLHGYTFNIPMLMETIKDAGIPVVWTLHDCFSFTGKCGYHFDCDKWKGGCGDCQYLKEYPKVYRDRTETLWKEKKELVTSIPQMTIVSPSEWLANEASTSYLGKYECITIRNGIDTDNIFYPRDKEKAREKYGFDVNDKIVLGIAIGFADPRKGAKYIIELAKELKDNEETKVVLVGWERENDHLIKDLNNVVTVPATKDAHTLAEYYSLADVFVIPSMAENYATTVVEALACGTPVVGFCAGGIPEQITDGRGICVEAGNQEALNEAVGKILNNREDYMSSKELSESIRQQNNKNDMVDKYIEVYKRLLDEVD